MKVGVSSSGVTQAQGRESMARSTMDRTRLSGLKGIFGEGKTRPDDMAASLPCCGTYPAPPTDAMGGAEVSRLFELVFASAADRTGPICGDICKSGPWGYAICRITHCRIILIATDYTNVFFHGCILFVVEGIRLSTAHADCSIHVRQLCPP